MARATGSSTDRGYGSDHRAARAAAIAAYRPGQPCARCGQPLHGDPARFDLGHDDHDRTRYRGLEHRSCNRGAGARQGNHGVRLIVAGYADRSPACAACGKKYHYAARACAICGAHYHPSGGQVMTCGRMCGVELRRRKYGYAGKGPRQPKPPPRQCQSCGRIIGSGSPLICPACTAVQRNGPSRSITYYTCRYCGKLGVAASTGQKRREVCPARECQLARLTVNRLIARKGMTREQADAQVTAQRSRDW